jgi:hypothetical protein
MHLLGAPYRSGSQLFVDARLKLDRMRLQVRAGFPERFVESAQWRPAIA